MVLIDTVKSAIASTINCSNLVVIDTSDGCGSKFHIFVSSKQFDGVSLIDRHRLVQSALSQYMNDIHAVEIKAWTEKQWNEKLNTIPKQ